MTRKHVARHVHAFTVTLVVFALLVIPHITDKYPVFAPVIGFGTSRVSMMGVPLTIVVHSILKERHGVYMGIVNMMTVIPMFIETVIFSWIYKTFLGANLSDVMIFVGVFLVVTASLTAMIRTSNKPVDVSENV